MKNLQTISDCFSSCTTLRNTYFKTKGIWHFSHTVPNSKNLPGLYEYSYECWYFKYVHFSLVKKPTKDPVPPTRLPQLLFSQTQFSADTNWLQKRCLKMGIYTCGNCKPYHQKKKVHILTYRNGNRICGIAAIAPVPAQPAHHTPWETFIKGQRDAVRLMAFSSVTMQIIWRIFFWAHSRILLLQNIPAMCSFLFFFFFFK